MSMSRQGCHNNVTVVVHNVQHSLIVPQQARIVAGLGMQGQMAKEDDSPLLLPGSAALTPQPRQLLLTDSTAEFNEASLCLRHPSRASRIVFVLHDNPD